MDRHELIEELAGCTADDFASFQRDVLVRRTAVLMQRLRVLATGDLRVRHHELMETTMQGMYAQDDLMARQREHVEWIGALGDGTDDADVAFSQDLGVDAARIAYIHEANQAELKAIATLLAQRTETLRDEKGGA